MAAKRVTASAINWAAIAERTPPNQKTNFTNFKAKSDKYVLRVNSSPATAPKIDWEYYRLRVPVGGMVDRFEHLYNKLTIPYPIDDYTKLVVEQEAVVKSEIEAFVKASNERIKGYEAEIKKLRALIPYDQMTMEDYREAYPEEALDPINRPTFWPHTPEEQLDHQPKPEQHH